jgi:hypothetical protein
MARFGVGIDDKMHNLQCPQRTNWTVKGFRDGSREKHGALKARLIVVLLLAFCGVGLVLLLLKTVRSIIA